MELLYWQTVAGLASFTAVLAIVVLGAVIFAHHTSYRRGIR